MDILFNISSKIYLKGLHKAIYLLIFALVDLFHYVLFIIKFSFIKKIMKKELCENADKFKTSILTWFYSFDCALNVFLTLAIIFEFCKLSCFFTMFIEKYDDKKINSLVELNGIKIKEFELSSKFDSLDEKSKNELIFKKKILKNIDMNYMKIKLIQLIK